MNPIRLLASFLAIPCLLGDVRADSPCDQPPPSSLQQLEREVATLRKRLDRLERRQIDRRPPADDPQEKAKLAAEVQRILAHFQSEKSAVWKLTHLRIRELRENACAALKTMQDDATRRALLDEALAIRKAITDLRLAGRQILTYPENPIRVGATSEVFFYRTTGNTSGSLYGTGTYTSDSSLSTAAVHAGILRAGETGIVKVTTIPKHVGFVSSNRHGITSSSWSSYPAYRVEALDDEDLDLHCEEGAAASPSITPPPPAEETAKADPFDGGAIKTPHEEPAIAPALPAAAREKIEQYRAETDALRKQARAKVAELTAIAVNELRPIQDAHTRAARLDEAIAVRDAIQRLTAATDER